MATAATSRASDGKVHLVANPPPLERDVFLRTLIRHLSGALQDVVGVREAEGFVTIVGQRMGDELNAMYRAALAVETLSPEQVGQVCVDLKHRIQGEFSIIEETPEKIVFANSACPFAEKVIGRPALCMMTSNVFGTIAAENLGYGKVALERTIASGAPECRVVLYIQRTAASDAADGREYIRSE
jgi:hypothetical protein